MTHPFRFGVLHTGGPRSEWQDFARKAEDLGYSTLAVQDHFGRQLAPLPALLSAAAATTRLRLATTVLDNDFRHPAALAKEAATVDLLTDGRLELGIGAGWLPSDYETTGITFAPGAERYARIVETVRICKAFFGDEETVTFHGEHYRLEALPAYPKPLQRPRPPILVGGRGRRMLSFAAREVDIVAISMLDRRGPGRPQPPSFAEKAAWARAAAAHRLDEIEIHCNAFALEVTDDARGALERIAARTGVTPEEARESPANIAGSVDAIVEQMQAWRERCGLNYFHVLPRVMEAIAPVIARLSGT